MSNNNTKGSAAKKWFLPALNFHSDPKDAGHPRQAQLGSRIPQTKLKPVASDPDNDLYGGGDESAIRNRSTSILARLAESPKYNNNNNSSSSNNSPTQSTSPKTVPKTLHYHHHHHLSSPFDDDDDAKAIRRTSQSIGISRKQQMNSGSPPPPPRNSIHHTPSPPRTTSTTMVAFSADDSFIDLPSRGSSGKRRFSWTNRQSFTTESLKQQSEEEIAEWERLQEALQQNREKSAEHRRSVIKNLQDQIDQTLEWETAGITGWRKFRNMWRDVKLDSLFFLRTTTAVPNFNFFYVRSFGNSDATVCFSITDDQNSTAPLITAPQRSPRSEGSTIEDLKQRVDKLKEACSVIVADRLLVSRQNVNEKLKAMNVQEACISNNSEEEEEGGGGEEGEGEDEEDEYMLGSPRSSRSSSPRYRPFRFSFIASSSPSSSPGSPLRMSPQEARNRGAELDSADGYFDYEDDDAYLSVDEEEEGIFSFHEDDEKEEQRPSSSSSSPAYDKKKQPPPRQQAVWSATATATATVTAEVAASPPDSPSKSSAIQAVLQANAMLRQRQSSIAVTNRPPGSLLMQPPEQRADTKPVPSSPASPSSAAENARRFLASQQDARKQSIRRKLSTRLPVVELTPTLNPEDFFPVIKRRTTRAKELLRSLTEAEYLSFAQILDMLLDNESTRSFDDDDWVQVIMCSYQTFTTAFDFIKELDHRFFDRYFTGNYSERCRYMRRITKFMKMWLVSDSLELTEPVVQRLFVFWKRILLSQIPSGDSDALQSLFKEISEALSQRIHIIRCTERVMDPFNASIDMTYQLLKKSVSSLSVVLPRADAEIPITSVLEIEPLDIAIQLTLLEYELYMLVRSTEFFDQAWNKKELKEKRAPNITRIIKHFNMVGIWVMSSILKVPTLRERQITLTRFIATAMYCFNIKNFHGVYEIVSALNSTPIRRLTQTWKDMAPEYTQKFDKLNDICDFKSNNKAYREALSKARPPFLPYIGVHLRDFLNLDESGRDKHPGDTIAAAAAAAATASAASHHYGGTATAAAPLPGSLNCLPSYLSATSLPSSWPPKDRQSMSRLSWQQLTATNNNTTTTTNNGNHGNSDEPTDCTLFNITKRERIVTLIGEFFAFRTKTYPFPPKDDIRNFLLWQIKASNAEFRSEKDVLALSKEIELRACTTTNKRQQLRNFIGLTPKTDK